MKKLLFLVFLSATSLSFGQDKFNLYGKITDYFSSRALKADIKIYKNETLFIDTVCLSSGRFSLDSLPINCIYKVEIGKTGYVSKFYTVDLRSVIIDDLYGQLKCQTDVSLFKTDYSKRFSYLDTIPIVDFYYNQMTGSLDYNKGRLIKLKLKTEYFLHDGKENEWAQYNIHLVNGDDFLKFGDIESAKLEFLLAKKIADTPEIQKRIKKCEE